MILGQPNKPKFGECEAGNSESSCFGRTDVKITCHYGNMWFCDECWDKEIKTSQEHMSPENQAKRVDAYRSSVESKVIQASRVIDSSIRVKSDIFNAATIAIVNIKKSIDENPEVTNKPYALAEELMKRFGHFTKVIFDGNQQISEIAKQISAAGTNQQAIQIYLNQMANQLRAEEREKLRIADINYKPQPVTKVAKIKTSGTARKGKLDIKELQKYAKDVGVELFTLQMFCVQKGVTPEMGANMLRRIIAEGKSEAPNG